MNPRYPLDRRLGGHQRRSGRRGEEKILDPISGKEEVKRSGDLCFKADILF
jgi:hypothetical protein